MARIEIELPERYIFSTELSIYIGYINYGGHLDNARLLELVSEARVRFFKFLGYSELDVEGVGVVIADAAVQYRSESFYNETMVIDVATRDFNKYGCDLVYRISDKSTGREVARGKTGIVFFNYETRKISIVPENFKALVNT